MNERYYTLTTLERLVREWREAQKAIDRIPPPQRKVNFEPLERLVRAHNALVKFVDEEMG
jgi:hypothetical protein